MKRDSNQGPWLLGLFSLQHAITMVSRGWTLSFTVFLLDWFVLELQGVYLFNLYWHSFTVSSLSVMFDRAEISVNLVSVGFTSQRNF